MEDERKLPSLADSVRELERMYWLNSYPQPHGLPDGVSVSNCTYLRVVLDAITETLPAHQQPRIRVGKAIVS